jgi:hypothetical protein
MPADVIAASDHSTLGDINVTPISVTSVPSVYVHRIPRRQFGERLVVESTKALSFKTTADGWIHSHFMPLSVGLLCRARCGRHVGEAPG